MPLTAVLTLKAACLDWAPAIGDAAASPQQLPHGPAGSSVLAKDLKIDQVSSLMI
jgi:hypothetical protein